MSRDEQTFPLWIQPYSDLHNEFSVFDPPESDKDSRTIVVLAGDIDLHDRAINWISHFKNRFWGWIYVPGNHERWGSYIDEAVHDIQLRVIKKRLKNVWVLDNDKIYIPVVGGVLRVLGCTLWTDYDRGDPMTIAGAVHESRDYREIKHNGGQRRITPLDLSVRHQDSLDWLTQELSVPYRGPTFVVTHHAPTVKSFKDKRNHRIISGCYHSNLEFLLRDHPVDLWVHGHIHDYADYHIHRTRIICNPRGYFGEEINDDFMPVLRIPIESLFH
jgi:hypothetical protein